jgi:hypothetical protein
MSQELKVEDALIATIPEATFVSVWGSTMYHIDDLPFNVKTYFPHIFGNLKKKTEGLKVRPMLPTPTKGQLPAGNSLATFKKDAKFLPKLSDFGFSEEEINKKWDTRACYKFVGGE